MPVYDYVCTACRHRFEVFRGLNEAGPHQCPLCEGPVLRAFAPPTIVFKGSGWAKKDRRSTAAPTRKTAAGAPTSGESPSRESESGESRSSESKPGESKSGELASSASTSRESRSGDSPPAAPAKTSSGSGG